MSLTGCYQEVTIIKQLGDGWWGYLQHQVGRARGYWWLASSSSAVQQWTELGRMMQVADCMAGSLWPCTALYPTMLLFVAVGALLLLSLSLLPESPRWLVLRGNLDLALKILHDIIQSNSSSGSGGAGSGGAAALPAISAAESQVGVCLCICIAGWLLYGKLYCHSSWDAVHLCLPVVVCLEVCMSPLLHAPYTLALHK